MATNTTNLNLIKPDLTDPVDIGDINSNMDTLDALGVGYRYVQTVYYTSSGTFVKADYPWLRAIRVRCVGGGGAGGGTTAGFTASGPGGGGGGGYAESFITDIAGLDASVTVTRGAGGSGVSGSTGNAGGNSSFGSLVIGAGGSGALAVGSANNIINIGAAGGTNNTGDFTVRGGPGSNGVNDSLASASGAGGSSLFGGGGHAVRTVSSISGVAGTSPGGGGSGSPAFNTDVTGGAAGGNGIVIVDLFG
jgi:hypothetical protein